MRYQNKNSGFTLIELMMVVAILGVLATVAIVSYTKYVERSHNSEATGILADIRLKQEAYRSAFHQYADLTDDGWVPERANAADWKTGKAWPNDKTDWNQLGVRPDSGVSFSYYGSAGAPGDAVPSQFTGFGIQNEDDFWYGAMARQDLNGNGEYGCFVVHSGFQIIRSFDEGASVCARE